MASIELADDFSLPQTAVTESIADYGRKGSGKTNTGGVLFEGMFAIGAQCVVLDPVGNWYGLRLSASGKRTGLDIKIFGGDHGDIPITPTSGKLLAETIVERKVSCVIDLMAFRPMQRKQFSATFAQELFELKKRDRTPLHLFVEEARLFAPQMPKSKLDVEMCDAFEQIVRLGRNYGLGVTLIDQRPQSVNKEVSSQTGILIVHQIIEKLGRKEIEDWVRSKSVAGAEALEHLADLKTGEAFVWSPGLPKPFVRIKVRKKHTYDASRTPELGETEDVAPRPLSTKDLEGLKSAMAEVVKQAEENDVGKLRARVRELEAQLARPVAAAKAVEKVVEKRVEVMVMDPTVIQESMALERLLQKELSPINTHVTAAVQLLARFTSALEKRSKKAPAKPAIAPKVLTTPPPAPAPVHRPAATGEKGSKAEENILRSIAWLNSIGIEKPRNEAVAFLAGYTPTGGYYNNTRGAMRSKGWIEYTSSGQLYLTDVGRHHAPPISRPLTVEDLHRAVLEQLSKAERSIMQPLLDQWPNAMSNEDLAAAAGYDPTGGYYNNTRGRLRSIGLIDYPEKGSVRAEDFLFPGR